MPSSLPSPSTSPSPGIGVLFLGAIASIFSTDTLFCSAGAPSLDTGTLFLDAGTLSYDIGLSLGIDAPSLDVFPSTHAPLSASSPSL